MFFFVKKEEPDIFQVEYLSAIIQNQYLDLNGRVFIDGHNLLIGKHYKRIYNTPIKIK